MARRDTAVRPDRVLRVRARAVGAPTAGVVVAGVGVAIASASVSAESGVVSGVGVTGVVVGRGVTGRRERLATGWKSPVSALARHARGRRAKAYGSGAIRAQPVVGEAVSLNRHYCSLNQPRTRSPRSEVKSIPIRPIPKIAPGTPAQKNRMSAI